jgi:hypothetical protein
VSQEPAGGRVFEMAAVEVELKQEVAAGVRGDREWEMRFFE